VAVIIDGLRTVIGTAGHGLANRSVDDLAAVVLAGLADRIPVDASIDDVILGNCFGPGGNPARVAALRAGLGVTVPAVTVDRQCASGLEAITQAVARLDAGKATVVLAGGMESASTAPWRFWADAEQNGESRLTRYTRAPFAPPGFADPEMGPAADTLAASLGIDRRRQDAWAARSYQRAWEADQDGVFDTERLPVADLVTDERLRPRMTIGRLARMRPVFSRGGTATAGNSCGISDGAAALTVVSEDAWHRSGRPQGLRIRAVRVAAGDPALPGAVPAVAVNDLLAAEHLGAADLQAVEITEAFAAQALATIEVAGLDPDTVCADGGAIAYGHPWGASGAILVLRLLRRLLTAPATETGLGLACCPVGGGQGMAMLLERTR
jgi:acetyl-CoA C-acetyltransferase